MSTPPGTHPDPRPEMTRDALTEAVRHRGVVPTDATHRAVPMRSDDVAAAFVEGGIGPRTIVGYRRGRLGGSRTDPREGWYLRRGSGDTSGSGWAEVLLADGRLARMTGSRWPEDAAIGLVDPDLYRGVIAEDLRTRRR